MFTYLLITTRVMYRESRGSDKVLRTGGSECRDCPAESVADLLEPAALRTAGGGGILVTLCLLLARCTGFLAMFDALIG